MYVEDKCTSSHILQRINQRPEDWNIMLCVGARPSRARARARASAGARAAAGLVRERTAQAGGRAHRG